MVNALPLTKLATLLIRTLAKPLSKQIKATWSKNSFTKGGLIWVGQTNHALSSRMQIWSNGYKVRNIKPLEEEKALKDGAEFLGEAFLFSVSGAVVVFEYNRSNESAKAKDAAKRAEAKAERRALQAKLIALDERLKAVEESLHQSQASSMSILGGGVKVVAPDKRKLVEIVEEEDEDEPTTPSPSATKETSASKVTPSSQLPSDTLVPDASPAPSPSPTASSNAPTPSDDAKPWWQIW
eukprot:Nitzschia sp. Nitz4//scaffold206_size41850//21596//22437//NITZ4_007423-RA/size41850-processed-gene-0.52-mRNA-1//-1//CDS//3329541568//978//frame0